MPHFGVPFGLGLVAESAMLQLERASAEMAAEANFNHGSGTVTSVVSFPKVDDPVRNRKDTLPVDASARFGRRK